MASFSYKSRLDRIMQYVGNTWNTRESCNLGCLDHDRRIISGNGNDRGQDTPGIIIANGCSQKNREEAG